MKTVDIHHRSSNKDVPLTIPLQSNYDEFQLGFIGLFGCTNISVGPNTYPDVSFIGTVTWVTHSYTQGSRLDILHSHL